MSKLPAALIALSILAASIASAQDTPQATPPASIKIKEGFKVELLYSVPKEIEGSWVAMTQDDKGRLIVSDQYGSLYRVTPPALNGNATDTKVEKIPVDFGHCQGLLYAFGALYGVVNDNVYQGRGLYRVKDTNGDDQFDTVEQLKEFPNKGGEHGPHGLVVGPDGKSIYIVSGNQTPLPPMDTSRVPRHWSEDQLFPMLIGKGFMREVMAPGGWVARTDSEGKTWELVSTGTRNTYDIAFNKQGDLLGFDADMEWDTGMPWYRPTRICMMQSGSEFGWRSCSKKWPARWEDSLSAVLDIGPGSPTGVSFGYGAKFPAAYQDAFYVSDWSYGKLYAVHLTPQGAGYTAKSEEFMSASPLPLTDLLISKSDGSMYVTVGGRKVQSGLYRITYQGKDSLAASPKTEPSPEHQLRTKLEAFHGKQDPAAVDAAWPHLNHPDRLVRYAARIAIEHQSLAQWQDRALNEKDPRAALTALMALARSSNGDKTLQPRIIEALNKIDLTSLKGLDRVTLIRDYTLCFTRLGEPDEATRAALVKRLGSAFPSKDAYLNRDLTELLIYLGDDSIVAKVVPLVSNAPTQEEQIDYARILRLAKTGWNQESRSSYFRWFLQAANYKGGASFGLFMDDIKKDALANMTDVEKAAIKDILDTKPEVKPPSFTSKPMQFVKAWTLEELEKSLGVGLEGGRNFQNGRNTFGATTCFACHRFNNEGGAVGPDLTSVSGKFSPRDLLENILNPNKEISDQYGSTVFTLKDGKEVIGRIGNLSGDNLMICTNMMDPNNFTGIKASDVTKTEASKVSMMPPGLLYMAKEDDILDLLAYLLSKGNPDDPMFK
ncbi:c-type cytochrome [soil metagenome]